MRGEDSRAAALASSAAMPCAKWPLLLAGRAHGGDGLPPRHGARFVRGLLCESSGRPGAPQPDTRTPVVPARRIGTPGAAKARGLHIKHRPARAGPPPGVRGRNLAIVNSKGA